MRAILLAAGFGTRLRPLTDKTPKCLLPVKGKPLLQIWVDNLIEAGIKKILINTHYLHEQVEEFFEKNDYKKYVTLIHEKELLGTAGTLIKNIDFFGQEDGLLIHSDNYCLENLNNFMTEHLNRPKSSLMTMMTFRTDTPEQCGIVELDKNLIVANFYEKQNNPPGNLANAAVYILTPELLTLIKNNMNTVKDFSLDVLNNLIGRIYTFQTNKKFIDIGTPKTYSIANEDYII